MQIKIIKYHSAAINWRKMKRMIMPIVDSKEKENVFSYISGTKVFVEAIIISLAPLYSISRMKPPMRSGIFVLFIVES